MSARSPGAGAATAAPGDTGNTEYAGSATPQVSRFFFDVLPLHPLPRPCESLTSYVARLARANGIASVGSLARAFFPTMPKQSVQRLADHAPPDLGTVATLTACAESTVRATTFAHVGEKFGRAAGPYEAQRFLGPGLAPSLRYCPRCLAEERYHRLPWRFTILPGCAEHRLALLDRCGHCGHALPFLGNPFTPGVCPACGGDLRSCAADDLDERGVATVERMHGQLLFLLAPSPAAADGRGNADRVAAHLAAARRAAGLTRPAAAARFGIAEQQVRGMERPVRRDDTKGPSLHTYLRYADALGVALSACFTSPPPGDEPPTAGDRHQHIYQGPLEHEERLVARARGWIEAREARGESITIAPLAAELGLSRRGLDYYPGVRQVLDGILERQREPGYRRRKRARREAALLAAVERQRAVLARDGQDLDPKAIGKLLGVSPRTVQRFATVQALIERITRADEPA